MADNLHFFVIKLISLFTKNFALVLNLYYLLTFPLTAFFSMVVFRYLKISSIISILCSQIYAFLPYHIMRGEAHLFLSSYYLIPLMLLILIWIQREEPITLINKKINIEKKLIFSCSLIIALLFSSAGVYYAFFIAFVLFIITMYNLFQKNLNKAFWSFILLITLCIGLLLNLLPSIIYTLNHGTNKLVVARSSIEAEVYGLKIAQFFVPVYDHGISILTKLINNYRLHPLPNEGSEYLGVIGIIGFIVLLVFILIKESNINNHYLQLVKYLSTLNIFCILLSTIGGIGSLFALVISPQIRAYNRISVIIAFFCFLTIALLLEYLKQNMRNKKFNFNIILNITLIIVFTFGIYEYYVPNFTNYTATKKDFQNDANFISEIESKMPINSMIFQLPYVPFPENPPVNNLGDYELFKGYLHSNHLKWSYGSMKGRESDQWIKYTANLPLQDMLESLVLSNFNGIYIDRLGYKDNGEQVISQIKTIINTDPQISSNNRLVFFNLIDYKDRTLKKYSSEELTQKRKSLLNQY
ncbi:hypothetical protein LJK88_03580 [Paenibacillus sp. P26]|nr:hypothetical protein LJK88_03580 [Paenibacillus sp. P26]